MLVKVYLGIFLAITLLQSLSCQSVTLTRTLLEQWLGDVINKKSLSLNNKNIKDIDRNAFTGLTNVQELYMASNALTTIENYYFKDLVNLELLVLEFNSIGKIAPDAFTGMTNLRDLYFHRNSVMLKKK